jgi:hypothetical protein
MSLLIFCPDRIKCNYEIIKKLVPHSFEESNKIFKELIKLNKLFIGYIKY